MELLKIELNNNQEQTVSARELHKVLDVKTRFSLWQEQNFKDFIEDEDFTSVVTTTVVNNGALRELEDYQITLEMAKHLAMLSRTEKGKQVRQYFIQVEKEFKKKNQVVLPSTYKEALKQLIFQVEENEKLQLENKVQQQHINELKPKADYMDTILQSKSLLTITQIAKDYGMSGIKMNALLHQLGVQFKQSDQWLLYSKYSQQGYTHSETIKLEDCNGRFYTKLNTKWTQKGRLFLYELLKKNAIIPLIEMEND